MCSSDPFTEQVTHIRITCTEVEFIVFLQRFRTFITLDHAIMEKIEQENGVVRSNFIFVSIYRGPYWKVYTVTALHGIEARINRRTHTHTHTHTHRKLS